MISASRSRRHARRAIDVATADVASLTAQMKEAAAAVDTAKANLGYTKITAPMAGEVVSINTARRTNAQRESVRRPISCGLPTSAP